MNEENITGSDTSENNGQSWKKAWKIFLGVCLLTVLALTARRILTIKEEVDISPLSTVSVTVPENGEITVETSLVATKMPGEIYYVIPMAAGEVKKIYVNPGDRVKKGDPICEIDNQKQIDAAKIQMDAAQVQIDSVNQSIELAKTNLDRMKALYAAGDISAQSYEQVKSSYDQAVAGLEGAKLQYDGAKLSYDTQVEFSTVTAPADGIVESTNMTEGNIASQTAQVAVISGDSSGKLQFNVTDRLLGAVKAGDEIRAEKQGKEYLCRIVSVSTFPGQNTGLYLVEAEIEDEGVIPTGSSVKVHFISEKSENAVTVPTDCIYYDGGHTYVYTVTYGAEDGEETARVMEGNKAATVHKVEVETGIAEKNVTEIRSGVGTDEEIIRTWTSQLYEGARVQVLGGGAQ